MSTAASAQAIRNWAANVEALAVSQSSVIDAVGSSKPSVTWVFGRDGFLTAHDPGGQWWAGCSLPKRAGLTLLKKLSIHGVVGGLLAPSHAGQVAAALEKLSPQQAAIVIQPDIESMRVMLRCCDFSQAIGHGRLWFAIGGDWAGMLGEIFAAQPGLPTPSQFIRTLATSEELIQEIIPVAEGVFRKSNEGRAARIAQLQFPLPLTLSPGVPGARETDTRILLVAGSHFRLWDDAGAALLSTGGGHTLDPDDPSQASALGLALAAVDCEAVVIPHRSRADLREVLPHSMPVISWIVQPRIPAFDAEYPRDALLLADEAWLPLAQAAGWPADRLRLAGWPGIDLPPASEKCLAMIADTFSLETPVTALESSSHHVLWEMIRADLAADPFALGTDVIGFIHRRMAKLGISEEGFDRSLFIDKLIVPAYQQGLARLLLDAGLPLKLFGDGWDELPRLRSLWQGPVVSREQFQGAVRGASALVYAWPMRYSHEIDAMNRPVLSPGVRRAENWVRDARRMLSEAPGKQDRGEVLSLEQIESLLR